MEHPERTPAGSVMRFPCPHCHKMLAARAPRRGATITCPNCQTKFPFRGTPVLPGQPAPVATRRIPPRPPATLSKPVMQPVLQPVPRQAAAPVTRPSPPPRERVADVRKRLPLKWILGGGGAAVALLLGISLFLLRGRATSVEHADSDDPITKTPPVVITTAKLIQTMNDDLVFSGKIVQGSRTQHQGFNSSITFLVWDAHVSLQNKSNVSVQFGDDLMLFELNANSSMLEGAGVFSNKAKFTNHSTYGLLHNYESGGTRFIVSGNHFSISPGFGSAQFAASRPGEPWQLRRGFEQGTWMREDIRVKLLLVLPEARVRTTHGVESFRILTYFAREAGKDTWQYESRRVVPIDRDELRKILSSGESTLVMRSLAANFLAESAGKDAAPALVDAARGLNEGELLATCLDLMTNLQDDGLATHAATLLPKTTGVPGGIRSMCARYLGAVRHAPAWEQIKKTAKDSDRSLANASIAALGAYGDDKSVDFLLELSREGNFTDSTIASALVASKSPKALRAVQGFAGQGNDVALDALVNAGLPETFDFFVKQAKMATTPRNRDQIARGLKAAGKEKALPALLDMLEQADETPEKMFYGDEIVRMISSLNLPAATPRLAELARKGSVRAAMALAQSRNETVRDPLRKLATPPEGAVARAAIQGLADHWSSGSEAIFAAAQKSSDPEIARIAKSAAERSQQAASEEALIKSARATPISLAKKIKGELTDAAKEVVYEVRLTAGKSYTIDMVSADTAALDPLVKVANPAGTIVGINDDGGEGLNSRLSFQAVTTGNYRIVATAFGSSRRGTYTLEIREE